ncbi:hypothetical protein [Bacteroides sp.]|uniref:hypothetical protein n=1 Tax=Bacteroides sp. TaxID=29523 RepID=UPI0025B8503E|nr:hypothetical protein [Bacteroides sp.]
MNDKLSISYHTAKKILLELLENNDFSTDEDVLKILGSIIPPKDTNVITCEKEEMSRIVIDKNGRIFLPSYSSMEVKMPYLPKTVFIFFLIHKEGIEFKSMYNYIQELYEIYQIVALEKNTEASKIRRSLENLVEPVNNRIYETCSIIRRSFSMVIPELLMEFYCITGKRGEKHQIRIDSSLIEIENEKLKEMFNLRHNH